MATPAVFNPLADPGDTSVVNAHDAQAFCTTAFDECIPRLTSTSPLDGADFAASRRARMADSNCVGHRALLLVATISHADGSLQK